MLSVGEASLGSEKQKNRSFHSKKTIDVLYLALLK